MPALVESYGNSLQTQAYQFQDSQPDAGDNYYRLKQIDFDGAITYHPVVVVFWKEELLKVNLFPNPGNDLITIRSAGPSTPIIKEVRFFDPFGSLQRHWIIGNAQVQLSTADLAAGLYLVEIGMESGGVVYQYFVKGR